MSVIWLRMAARLLLGCGGEIYSEAGGSWAERQMEPWAAFFCLREQPPQCLGEQPSARVAKLHGMLEAFQRVSASCGKFVNLLPISREAERWKDSWSEGPFSLLPRVDAHGLLEWLL